MDKVLLIAQDNQLSRQFLPDSLEKAIKTAKAVLKYVEMNRNKVSPQELFLYIENLGKELGSAAKMCFPVTNTLKRIVSEIR